MISRQYITVSASSYAAPASSMNSSSGLSVTKYSGNYTKLRGKDDEELGLRIGNFLSSRYPRKTAEMVAADLGISPTTVLPWIEGRSVPGGKAMRRLFRFYGPEFAAAAFDLPWLTEAARTKQLQDAKAARAALDERIARLSA